MKTLFLVSVLLIVWNARAQNEKTENIFIITTDGLRWQEVFNGADSFLLTNPKYVQDTVLARQLFWDASPQERRKKLMPFFWNVLAEKGQLYGNRQKKSHVNVTNIYKISYPGYNELLTGYADPLPILNKPQYNRNQSVLEYLHNQPNFKDSVAAFTSWNVFPFILNRKRNTMLQNSGYAALRDTNEGIQLVNEVQNNVVQKYKTRYDALTFFTAKEYIRQHHPRVVFLGLGETDEFAHRGLYDLYLQQINNVDRMIAELWYCVQTDPFYRNNTTFIISTDHGRGRGKNWVKHHTFVRSSGEIWLGLLGKGIAPAGEMQEVRPIKQNQVAATVVYLLGEDFNSHHKTGEPIALPLPESKMTVQEKVPAVNTLVANTQK